MKPTFFYIEKNREELEDLGRRHERFPYALNEANKRTHRLKEDFDYSHHKYFYDKSVKLINEKPRHLREFSGRFMDVFNCLFVGNGFRHLENNINFLQEGQDMIFKHDSFVLPEEKELEFLASIDTVEYMGKHEVPKIPHDAKNSFFTNGWSQEHDAYLLSFNDGKKPMFAYISDTIYGEAYSEGELLIANEKENE